LPNSLRSPIRSALRAAALFAVAFLVYAACPIVTSYDSRWTIPVALSLLDRGDTNLDEYSRVMDPTGLRKAASLLHRIVPEAIRHRRYLVPYLLVAFPIVAAFFAYNVSIYGRLLPTYFTIKPAPPSALAALQGLTGMLISPSRWNVSPNNVDQNTARLWNLRDPQFLRGLRR
jgi:hypothetical protein